MNKQKMLFLLFVTTLCSCAWTQQFRGVVFSVNAEEIEILVPADQRPTAGTRVELVSKAGQSTSLWTVTRSQTCLVFAKSQKPNTSTPQLGQTVLIGKPEPKPQPKPVKPVVTTTPPAPKPQAPTVHSTPPTPKPTPKKPEPKPTPPPLSLADQKLVQDLTTKKADRIRYAAKILYKGRYTSPYVIEQAAQVLQEQFNDNPTNGLHIDAMSWLCKALWASNDKQYVKLLNTVGEQAISPKLKKFAIKYGQSLEQKRVR